MRIEDYTPNTMVLQCPQCGKALVKSGSKVERIHPIPKFCKDHYMQIVGWNAILSVILVGIFSMLDPNPRSAGFALVALLMLPSTIMFALIRAFSLYRITDCPACGYHHKQKLGRFPTA